MSKRHDDIIKNIMAYGRFKTKELAEAWAIKEFGNDWRTRSAVKAKRIVVKQNEEKEWDDE
ncbi:hypothetical protein BM607_009295 [Shewanella sp. SACH]|uniref:hypothetical protein n=1 Tax=Shewanella sp. SACH TaxID=1873135 RepID=UPI000903F9AE|nr:hypothetical protein [Shewanella sp. SACH]OUS51444.1 hypothetical protein BM607_009295 [Shewanella sp. SACH]